MNSIRIIGFFLWLIVGASVHAKTLELELEEISFNKAAKEISGMIQVDSEFFLVADKPADHFLYQRNNTSQNEFELKPHLNLSNVKGFSNYIAELKKIISLPEKLINIDFEGMAYCKDIFYIADEKTRQVISVRKQNSEYEVTRLPIKFGKDSPLFKGEPNAGLEGIAVDCGKQVLYLAKEREPRGIMVINMKTMTEIAVYDIPSSNRAGQKSINFTTGDGLVDVPSDFADLSFDKGYLYALERNTFEIAKIDVTTWKVVQRVSYFFSAKDLYTTGEPYGVAEALTLSEKEIFLGSDNNQAPLSVVAQKKYGRSDNASSILTFKRPSGF